MESCRVRLTDTEAPLTVAATTDPWRAVTCPLMGPNPTALLRMDTPPSEYGPVIRTVRRFVVSANRMDNSTVVSPFALGPLVETDPVTVVLKGTDGSPDADAALVGVLDDAWRLYVVVAEPASSARSLGDVPERCDHPARSGPATAKTEMPWTTNATASPPSNRQEADGARPAARRHITAAATDPTHATKTRSAPGRRESEPEPRPWTTAIGQHT